MDNKIIDLYLKSLRKFNGIESQPRDFGIGDLLFRSEAHTLEVIGKYPGSNLTELSERLDITKGGTTKFIKKLLAKELIIKERLPNNKKETLYRLTDKGVVAFNGHKVFSDKMFGEIYHLLDVLSIEEASTIEGFLTNLNRIIGQH